MGSFSVSSHCLSLLSFFTGMYLLSELLFVAVFYRCFLPQCQRLRQEEPYRDYGRNRHKLLLRVIGRMERTSQVMDLSVLEILQMFLKEWFHQSQTLNPVLWNEIDSPRTFPLRKGDLDQFFSWAFFGRDRSNLLPWMDDELEQINNILLQRTGLKTEPGVSPTLKPMRLTLDPIRPYYRPLAVYLLFTALRVFSYLFLISAGFRCYTTKRSLRYWYRPRGQPPSLVSQLHMDTENNALPIVFFHGIAPGGIALYLPMLLWGFGRDRRPLFLFETPSISFSICWKSPTEAETTEGVWEALSTHLGQDHTGVCITGHSFGTCQVTWLLRSAASAAEKAAGASSGINAPFFKPPRIRQVLLIDPIAIGLSEPDVMVNFLYNRETLQKKTKKSKIGMVANELFIEHYLRRQFFWYNSELWMDDIPSDCKVIVCLSDNDEILNAKKVKREVEFYCDDIGGSMTGGLQSTGNLQLIVWRDATHAHCISRPSTWKQMRSALRRQEQAILKEVRLKEL